MSNFFRNLILNIITYIICFAFLAIGSVSFLSKEFPPKISTFKKYLHDITHASENYKNMVARSEVKIKKEILADEYAGEDASGKANLTELSSRVNELSSDKSNDALNNLNNEISLLKLKLSHIESQLDKIDQQNQRLLNQQSK